MYGIPDNVDWSFLIGKELIQVAIGLHHVALNFDGNISIGIQSDFKHLPVANSSPGAGGLPQRATSLVSLLGSKVLTATRQGSKTLAIAFSNKEDVRLHDDSDSYESFQITGPGIQIIV